MAESEWAWIIDLIAEYGRSVTLSALTGTVDATKPWRGNDPAQVAIPAASVVAVFAKIKLNATNRDLVKDGDTWAYIANTGVAADSYEMLTDSSVKWKIIKAHKIQPGDEILLYKLHLRR